MAPTVAEHPDTRAATKVLPAAPALSRRRVLTAGGAAAIAVTAAVTAPVLLNDARKRPRTNPGKS